MDDVLRRAGGHLSDSATNPIGTHISKLPAAIEDVWPIVDESGVIVELVRTWEDDAYVCLDEHGQPVDDIAHTHHLIPRGLFRGSSVPDEWNIVAVRRVSSGMTRLESLTAENGGFDERREREVLTQLNAGAGIVIDEIDTSPPYTHIVQIGGEFYLAQMKSPAGMARLAGDDSVLGDLAATEAPPPNAPEPPPVPVATAPTSSHVETSPPDAPAPALPPGAPAAEAPRAAKEASADPGPSVTEEIARQVEEATAKEAAAGKPRRKRPKAAGRQVLSAVAEDDGVHEPAPDGEAPLAAVAKPEGTPGESRDRGVSLDAVAKPDSPVGGSAARGAGLAAVAKADDGPSGGTAADLLKAMASPLDASVGEARLETREPVGSASPGLRSALDPDGHFEASAIGRAEGAAMLVDELRPDGEADPLRAASLAQADEFVSSAADGTLEISDDVLGLDQVLAADRFAWDELMNLYLPHIGFVAARVAGAGAAAGMDVTYLPRPESAMRPIGWHHLAGCDCEFCR